MAARGRRARCLHSSGGRDGWRSAWARVDQRSASAWIPPLSLSRKFIWDYRGPLVDDRVSLRYAVSCFGAHPPPAAQPAPVQATQSASLMIMTNEGLLRSIARLEPAFVILAQDCKGLLRSKDCQKILSTNPRLRRREGRREGGERAMVRSFGNVTVDFTFILSSLRCGIPPVTSWGGQSPLAVLHSFRVLAGLR